MRSCFRFQTEHPDPCLYPYILPLERCCDLYGTPLRLIKRSEIKCVRDLSVFFFNFESLYLTIKWK